MRAPWELTGRELWRHLLSAAGARTSNLHSGSFSSKNITFYCREIVFKCPFSFQWEGKVQFQARRKPPCFRMFWSFDQKPPSHHSPSFVVKRVKRAQCGRNKLPLSQHDVTLPGRQNVHMKMSNYSAPLLESCQVWKNHSGKIAELAAEDGALYQGSARQIFWSGRV